MIRRQKKKAFSSAEGPILVTGGPTRAYLDDVRYVSNLSTGEIAFRICEQLLAKGADVIALVGPTSFPFEKLGLMKLYRVETNDEMHQLALSLCRKTKPRAVVLSAAVLDFVPDRRLVGKVSSKKTHWQIRLKPAPKIIDDIANRYPHILRFGFKLETTRLSQNEQVQFGRHLIQRKRLAGLCLNFLHEIRGGRHRARLFVADGSSTIVTGKIAIAKWISAHLFAQLKNEDAPRELRGAVRRSSS